MRAQTLLENFQRPQQRANTTKKLSVSEIISKVGKSKTIGLEGGIVSYVYH